MGQPGASVTEQRPAHWGPGSWVRSRGQRAWREPWAGRRLWLALGLLAVHEATPATQALSSQPLPVAPPGAVPSPALRGAHLPRAPPPAPGPGRVSCESPFETRACLPSPDPDPHTSTVTAPRSLGASPLRSENTALRGASATGGRDASQATCHSAAAALGAGRGGRSSHGPSARARARSPPPVPVGGPHVLSLCRGHPPKGQGLLRAAWPHPPRTAGRRVCSQNQGFGPRLGSCGCMSCAVDRHRGPPPLHHQEGRRGRRVPTPARGPAACA